MSRLVQPRLPLLLNSPREQYNLVGDATAIFKLGALSYKATKLELMKPPRQIHPSHHAIWHQTAPPLALCCYNVLALNC